jgi:uncharacterized protein (DUF305 family)
MQRQHGEHTGMSLQMQRHHYNNLILSLIIMYLAMFAMIYSWGEFIQNINFFYMALVMWAPMAALMLLTMKSMYQDTRLNMILYIAFALIFILSLAGIRAQALVGDRQFLRSMIPHHLGAVLMCERAKISDPEIVTLCGQIIQSQRAEIDQMKGILARR